jgi:hypothetical protein
MSKSLPTGRQGQAGKCHMSVEVENGILKSKTLNLFQGKVQNDTLAIGVSFFIRFFLFFG